MSSAAPQDSTSILLKGGTILSYNDQTSTIDVIKDGSVLITDSRIASITHSAPPPSELPQNTEVHNMTGKIICPGFVDTHRHLWQSAFRTIGSNTTLGDYFVRFGEYASSQNGFTPEDIYLGQLMGVYESLNAGVTTILDHAHATFSPEHAEMGLKASVESGGRIFYGYTIHELGPKFYSEDEQLKDLERLQQGPLNGGLVEVGAAWDGLSGPFTEQNVERTKKVWKVAEDLKLPFITTHYVGEPWITNGTIQKFSDLSLLSTSVPLIFSHSTGLTQNEAALLRRTNQHISITPESESHYGHLYPNSHRIQDQASLGIDTHFTFSADILTQARLWLQITRYRLFEKFAANWGGVPSKNPMSAQQVLLLATRNGGQALHRDDIGVLKEGALADIAIIGTENKPNLVGWSDAIAAVVLHANVGDVEGVLVGGKWVKKDGKLVAMQDGRWESIKEKFEKSAKRIQESWANTKFPAEEGTCFINDKVEWGVPEIVNVNKGEGNGY